jgi:hypothetical protein
LARHDSAKTDFKYRQVVTDTLFEINRDKSSGWEMPGWLVHMEMERDAEGWISRAIKYGWIAEAIGWTRQLLRDVSDFSTFLWGLVLMCRLLRLNYLGKGREKLVYPTHLSTGSWQRQERKRRRRIPRPKQRRKG